MWCLCSMNISISCLCHMVHMLHINSAVKSQVMYLTAAGCLLVIPVSTFVWAGYKVQCMCWVVTATQSGMVTEYLLILMGGHGLTSP